MLGRMLDEFLNCHGRNDEAVLRNIFHEVILEVGWWYYIAIRGPPPLPINQIGYIMASIYVILKFSENELHEFFYHVGDYPSLFKAYCFCLNASNKSSLTFFTNPIHSTICINDYREEANDDLERKLRKTERYLDFAARPGDNYLLEVFEPNI